MLDTNFNEPDARKFYGVLGHHQTEYTEIRILDPTTKELVKRDWFQNENNFIEFCRQYSGTHTIWAGLNPRKTRGGTSEDVSRRTTILIDLDIHHVDGTPATLRR